MKSQLNQNPINDINIGVDTGKSQLDIFIRPLDIHFTVTNDAVGIREALKRIKPVKPARIVIEATGRLEHAFVLACAKAKLPIVIANPVHIKRFAQATGQLAKTDKLDAQLIAYYGETIQPAPSSLSSETITHMKDLVVCRNQLLGMQTMQKNRAQIMPKETQCLIKPILTALKKQIEKVEHKLETLINKCDEYKTKSELIQSVPGVGKVVAVTLISHLPELGSMNNKQAAALIGVAPINKESGQYQGRRSIRGGRHQVRTVMYMAMMSAIQCNPVIKQKYQSLLAQGKPKKVALIACVRKMIVLLNAMVRDGTAWQENAVT